MSEEQQKNLTLSDIPVRRVLEDGNKLLAETQAFVVLENGRTAHYGGYVAEHTVQLLRLHTDTQGPHFKLVVHKRADDPNSLAHDVTLDSRCRIAPALRKLRKETHFLKPEGESLLKAIATSAGEEINLYTFDVLHPAANPILNLLRIKQQRISLGFKQLEEAMGWYVYVAACANIMSETDPDFTKVIGHQQTLAEHAAATPALLLNFDDQQQQQQR